MRAVPGDLVLAAVGDFIPVHERDPVVLGRLFAQHLVGISLVAQQRLSRRELSREDDQVSDALGGVKQVLEAPGVEEPRPDGVEDHRIASAIASDLLTQDVDAGVCLPADFGIDFDADGLQPAAGADHDRIADRQGRQPEAQLQRRCVARRLLQMFEQQDEVHPIDRGAIPRPRGRVVKRAARLGGEADRQVDEHGRGFAEPAEIGVVLPGHAAATDVFQPEERAGGRAGTGHREDVTGMNDLHHPLTVQFGELLPGHVETTHDAVGRVTRTHDVADEVFAWRVRDQRFRFSDPGRRLGRRLVGDRARADAGDRLSLSRLRADVRVSV